jgi:hypothetical protein
MGARPLRGALLAVLLTALAAALLAGCSSVAPAPPGPTPTPTPTGSPQEQALAWTESVCGALVPVVARLSAAPALDLGAPEATRQAYLTYLGDGLAVTDRARATLAAAGPAPVPDGDVIAEQVRGNLADLRADVADARRQVERTDPGSAVSVGRVLVGGSKIVGALLNSAQVAGTLNRDPALADAYGRAPACAQLQRSGAPPNPEPTAAPSVAVEPTR